MIPEHYKNTSLENIVEECGGIIYHEQWADIEGYEGLYEVSNFGRVKRLKRTNCNNQHKSDKIMSPTFNDKGYLRISFKINSISKTFSVARLVGLHFIPNPENKPEINHLKGIKTDNRHFMLEWSTASENQKHSFSVLGKKAVAYWAGKKGGEHHAAMPAFCKELNKTFTSLIEAADYFNVSSGYISMVCKGQRKTVKGLTLNYV
mgnify:CR=1 FL=1